MSFLDSLRWRKKAVNGGETKGHSKVLGISDELGAFLIYGADGGLASTPSSAMNLYKKSSAISIPVNYIAEAFASINPVLKQGTEIIRDHPVLDLLRAPSTYYPQDLFLETLGKDYLITGETNFVAVGSVNRPPIELQPINPINSSPTEGSGGTVDNWRVTGLTLTGTYNKNVIGRRARYLRGSLAEFGQIRNYSPVDNSLLRGYSPISSASAEARQHIKGNAHNISILDNGGRLSLVFHFDEDLELDNFIETRDKVISQYGGTQNAGKIGVTSGGKLDIKEFGVNNKDMDFATLQNIAKQSIALAYKFPLPLLTTDASTFNNYEKAKEALYDDSVLPLADRIFGGLSLFLLPRYGIDPQKMRITYDIDQITALQGRRNTELKLRKDLNIETVNELRALLGREPIANGDDVLAPANLVPIGTDLFTEDNTPSEALARDKNNGSE